MSRPEDLPVLDPELAALLAEEAARPDPTAAAKTEVAQALRSSLAAAAAGAVTSQGGVAATIATAGASATSTPGAAVAGAGMAGVKVLPLIAAFALGAGAGVGAYRSVAPEPAPRVEVVVKEVRVEVPVPAAPAPTPAPEAAPEPAPTPDLSVGTDKKSEPARMKHVHTKAEATESPQEGRDSELAEENSLIARAQTALSRRTYPRAVDALRAHAAQYPNGQLVEEREALWVQALAGMGDADAARARAESFSRRFPGSPLRAVVTHALEQLP